MSHSQCLITGVYRSGTEYIAQLLSGHPQLSSTMYHVNALRFIRGRYEPLSNEENVRRAVSDTRDRLQNRYQLALDTERVLQCFGASSAKTYFSLYDAIMSVLWLKDGVRHWAEKCQLLWREIPEFITGMPNGKAILVLRDPRSTLASFKHYTYAPPPAYLGAIFNCLDVLKRAKDYQATLPIDRFHIVRYEDAAREPHRIAERLFRFLGLDSSQASFERDSWRNEKGERWQDNTAFKQAFDVGQAIERWRTVLDPTETALTEEVCGETMRTFDYQPEGAPLDWRAALTLCLADTHITEYLRQWLLDGEGIQAFPTDPLKPENWDEIRKTSSKAEHAR
jgi:hypothetical protein